MPFILAQFPVGINLTFCHSSSLSALGQEMQSDKGVSRWLFCVCGVVFCIVVIGGATRLTRSGLSMVRDPTRSKHGRDYSIP
jgi:hypothetical protein